MIFALIDYLQYRKQRGRYGIESLKSEGANLAVAENFSWVESLKPGDVCFCHTRDSFVSWMIMYHTSCPWSHMGTFSEHGNIIDATTAGVIEHPFSDYYDGKSYILIKSLHEVISDDQRQLMLERGRSLIGCGFNWVGIIRLYFYTVGGFHSSYRPCYTMDIILSLALLSLLLVWIPGSTQFIGVVCLLYFMIVIASIPARRKMRRIIETQPEPGAYAENAG